MRSNGTTTSRAVSQAVLEAIRAKEGEAEARLTAARERIAQAQAEETEAIRELTQRRAERALAESAIDKPAAAPPARRKRSSWVAFAVAPIAAVALGAVIAWEWSPLNIRVCSSSMTASLAGSIVRAFGDGRTVLPYHFTLMHDGGSACDVRFFTAMGGYKPQTIERDALVAIVNPSNTVSTIQPAQLRSILAGHGMLWSELGGSDAPITALLPPDGSDEAALAKSYLGKTPGNLVMRTMSAADILHFVSGPDGTNAIGFVPLSVAKSAKVLTLAGSPPPDDASIASEAYPLTVRLVVGSDYRNPTAPAAALLRFALNSAQR